MQTTALVKTVLIVEDEYLIAVDLQSLLEGHGWTVLGPASTIGAALALLERSAPDVAILDVNLGGKLVTPVATALNDRRIPFMVSSAYVDPERIAGSALIGVPHLMKPLQDRQVLGMLDRLLAKAD